jgi:hypothetical protein
VAVQFSKADVKGSRYARDRADFKCRQEVPAGITELLFMEDKDSKIAQDLARGNYIEHIILDFNPKNIIIWDMYNVLKKQDFWRTHS